MHAIPERMWAQIRSIALLEANDGATERSNEMLKDAWCKLAVMICDIEGIPATRENVVELIHPENWIILSQLPYEMILKEIQPLRIEQAA